MLSRCWRMSTRSIGISNSQRASIASRPLLKRVALSIRDLRPHLPGRVLQCLLRRDAIERVHVVVAERAAGGGQRESIDGLHRLAPEALPDRRVLRVDRAQLRAAVCVRLEGGAHDVPADDEHLLVGERDDLAGLERPQRRLQPEASGGGHDHDVHVRPHGQFVQRQPGVAAEFRGEVVRLGAGARAGRAGAELLDLFAQQRDVAAAASAATRKRSGKPRTTSSVCVPIEPVEPRIARPISVMRTSTEALGVRPEQALQPLQQPV